MLTPNMGQEQYEITYSNNLHRSSSELVREEPLFIVKTMMKIIKSKTHYSMDEQTRVQFSKITDAIVQMVDEIRE